MSEVALVQSGDRRRVVVATPVALLLGLGLTIGGATTQGTFSATTLTGVGLVLVGLVLLARLPAYFRRSTLVVTDADLRWEGVGAPSWTLAWDEVDRLRLTPAQGPAAPGLLVVEAAGEEVRLGLSGRGVDDRLRDALARHAPRVPVEHEDPGLP